MTRSCREAAGTPAELELVSVPIDKAPGLRLREAGLQGCWRAWSLRGARVVMA